MEAERREFLVDGETFSVRLDEEGGFDCVWLTGPNPGHGFGSGAPVSYATGHESAASPSTGASPRGPADDDHVTVGIRSFLSMVDPKTGFIGD